MLIEWFLSIKSLPNLLFGVLCLPGDQSHPCTQPTINPRCVASAGLVYWVEGFFLLGTKARILGLTVTMVPGQGGWFQLVVSVTTVLCTLWTQI